MPVIDRFESVNMLTSSASQYLPPDYLQPLPTTLDAKNSPLALLAQTCSSIGKDPPSKPIIPPLEKKDSSPHKSPATDGDDKSASPRDGRSSGEVHRSSVPSASKDIPHFYPISTSSPKPEKSQSDNQRIKRERKNSDNDTKISSHTVRPLSSSSSTGLNGLKPNIDKASPRPRPSDQTKDSRDPKYSPPPKGHRSVSPVRRDHSPGQDTKQPHSLYPGLPYGSLGYPGLGYPPGALPPSAEALIGAGYPYNLSAQSGYSLASAHALAAHQAALKSSSSAALSQYMQYARMRAPVPGVPGCKDPYCTNCVAAGVPPPPAGSHMAQCTSPGCAQCTHEKALHGLFGLHGASSIGSPLGVPTSSSLGLSHLHSLYAQNLLSQQGQQHVCNWMVGSEYCGKRFSSSEELLQHLRTHTSGGEAGLGGYPLGLYIPHPGDLSALPPGYLGSAAAGSMSPEALRRLYPTSLSPLSGGALSSRYHPYKSALPNITPPGPSHPSLSALGQYYSPLSAYGQRIGSAAVP